MKKSFKSIIKYFGSVAAKIKKPKFSQNKAPNLNWKIENLVIQTPYG